MNKLSYEINVNEPSGLTLEDFKKVLSNNPRDVNKIFEDNFIGYNAKTDAFEDLKLAGVIDPTKVTRMALENAASIAGMVLLTSAAIDNCN